MRGKFPPLFNYIRKNLYIPEPMYLQSLEIAKERNQKYPEYLRNLISEDIKKFRSFPDFRKIRKKPREAELQVPRAYISSQKRIKIFSILREMRKLLDD